MEERERTFIMIKPDGVQRRLVGKIIQRFENKGFKLMGLKMMRPSEKILREHYQEHSKKSFYSQLVAYMMSAPVVVMVWECNNAVSISRKMIGDTNPLNSATGTIRGDFGFESGRNIIHGSDSIESAKREIDLWFKSNELSEWDISKRKWIFEKQQQFSDVKRNIYL